MVRNNPMLLLTGLSVLLAALLSTPGATAEPVVRTHVGETKAVGNGYVRTWVTTDAKGTPLAIGIVLTDRALIGLPDAHTEFALALPAGVTPAPYNHFALDWNPQGHIPPGVYDVPHFDVHFYFYTPEERAHVTATGEDIAVAMKAPPAGYLPEGYLLAPESAEPHMGAHAVNTASPEFHEHPFAATFIYGYYNGGLTFLEPMVTRAFLQQRQAFQQPVVQPQFFARGGYYPMRYAIRYQPAKRQTVIALQGLTLRTATPVMP